MVLPSLLIRSIYHILHICNVESSGCQYQNNNNSVFTLYLVTLCLVNSYRKAATTDKINSPVSVQTNVQGFTLKTKPHACFVTSHHGGTPRRVTPRQFVASLKLSDSGPACQSESELLPSAPPPPQLSSVTGEVGARLSPHH